MKKILLYTSMLVAFTATAQDYEWQWAKRGGGTAQAVNESDIVHGFDSEQVFDIEVDSDNNYYYLVSMTQFNTEFDGTSVTVYNPQQSVTGPDIVLLSTNCEGTLRWTQTIGGGGEDYAYKIELDNNGGLYIGANIMNISSSLDPYLPPHFSPDDVMPVLGDNTGEPNEGYKTITLLKYNTSDGSLAWRVMPQGDVTLPLRWASFNQLDIDSEGVVHILVGLAAGSHVNGQVVVPSSFNNTYQYYVLKYSAQGTFIDAITLPVTGILLQHHTDFRFDENLLRYYIAGFRTNGDQTFLSPLSLDGIELNEQAYIMAFSNSGNTIWVKEVSSVSSLQDNRIYALEIDSGSNIYIAGKYFLENSNQGVDIGGYQLPVNVIGNIAYVLKFNSAGQVQWVNVPTSYSEISNPNFWTGNHFSYDISILGNEIGIATEVSDETWGTVSIDRPANHWSDPGLLRINKETGEAIALHDIMTSSQSWDALTAVAVDNDGNYVVGGYFHKDLFTLANDNVPTLTKVAGEEDFSDFFVAKLAASPCGTPASTNGFGYNSIKVYPNPATGIVNIQTQEELKSYEVVSMLGQVLLEGEFQNSQSLSIESLSAGTYILNINTSDGNVLSHKIVRE